MRSPSRWVLLSLAAALSAACGSKQAPEQPAPQPTAPAPTAPAPLPTPAPAPAPTAPTTDVGAAAAAARVTAAVLAEVGTVVHFDLDESDIRTEDRAMLDRKAALLSANSGLRLIISGHADERGADEYNLALGNRRAGSVKSYLGNKGIAATRLEVVSYGEERPVSMGHDEDSWFQNRRAEFEVTTGGSNLRLP
ncbi:MAG: peptidoglycan-associated lipoprotein Pal [Gemmatimonadota bacterium]|nr:peptidoglycan-associated lipoprotein Pal [Gemmatimonadota bacterium]